MALSLINYFVLDIKEARIPLMLLDGLVIFGLNVWERKLKEEKELLKGKEAIDHETKKKDKQALKAVSREQRKAAEKKTKTVNGQSNFAPKHNIMQPDKSKKN